MIALRNETRHSDLPGLVRTLLIEAVQALPDDIDGRVIRVHAFGHQCSGSDYERSSHEIVVEPLMLYS